MLMGWLLSTEHGASYRSEQLRGYLTLARKLVSLFFFIEEETEAQRLRGRSSDPASECVVPAHSHCGTSTEGGTRPSS